MMRILFLLVTIVAALAVVLPVYRARAVMLRRLQALVDHGADEQPGAREGRNLARFLPPSWCAICGFWTLSRHCPGFSSLPRA